MQASTFKEDTLEGKQESKLLQGQAEAQEIDYEIECPRCADIMILCSDFDKLYYQCEECDFLLVAMKSIT
jgi:hypothetical protein